MWAELSAYLEPFDVIAAALAVLIWLAGLLAMGVAIVRSRRMSVLAAGATYVVAGFAIPLSTYFMLRQNLERFGAEHMALMMMFTMRWTWVAFAASGAIGASVLAFALPRARSDRAAS